MISTVVLLFALIIVYALSTVLHNRRYERDLAAASNGIPNGQISNVPYLGDALHAHTDQYGYLREQHEKHGNIFRTYLLGNAAVFIAGVEGLTQIAKMDRSHLTAGWNNNLRRLWGQDSVLFSDGDLHKRVRGIMLSVANFSSKQEFTDLIHKVFGSEIEKWQQNKGPTEVHGALTKAISSVMFTYVWGLDCPQAVRDELLEAFGVYSAAVQGIVPVDHTLFDYGKGMEAKRVIDSVVSAEVDRREQDRATSQDRTDAMQALINAHWGGEITRAELVANCRALVFSSVDTTAASMTIAVHFVLKHPEILAKVREESTRVLGEGAWQKPVGSGAITPAKLKELVYTEATIKEAFRMQVPATLSTRLVKKDMPITIGGKTYVLPRGVNVYNSFYYTIHSFEGYTDPQEARPERFLGSQTVDEKKISSYMFGIGARLCPGSSMAMVEMIAFLSMFSTMGETKLANEKPVEYMFRLFPYPKDGLWIHSSRGYK